MYFVSVLLCLWSTQEGVGVYLNLSLICILFTHVLWQYLLIFFLHFIVGYETCGRIFPQKCKFGSSIQIININPSRYTSHMPFLTSNSTVLLCNRACPGKGSDCKSLAVVPKHLVLTMQQHVDTFFSSLIIICSLHLNLRMKSLSNHVDTFWSGRDFKGAVRFRWCMSCQRDQWPSDWTCATACHHLCRYHNRTDMRQCLRVVTPFIQ